MMLENPQEFRAKKLARMKQLRKDIRPGKRIWMVNPYGGGDVVEHTITSRVVVDIFTSTRPCPLNPDELWNTRDYITDAVGYGQTDDGKFDKYIGFSKKSAIEFAERWATDLECVSILHEHNIEMKQMDLEFRDLGFMW